MASPWNRSKTVSLWTWRMIKQNDNSTFRQSELRRPADVPLPRRGCRSHCRRPLHRVRPLLQAMLYMFSCGVGLTRFTLPLVSVDPSLTSFVVKHDACCGMFMCLSVLASPPPRPKTSLSIEPLPPSAAPANGVLRPPEGAFKPDPSARWLLELLVFLH